MKLNLDIIEGFAGGLYFNFEASTDGRTTDRDVRTDTTFSIPEAAFVFVEGAVATVISDWSNFRHWGVTAVSRGQWLEIFESLAPMRDRLRNRAPRMTLTREYPRLTLVPRNRKLEHGAVLAFLDRFEARVRKELRKHAFLVIHGI